ncbi:MarC family protein [Algoriphagus sp. D3-2-R+10]|uniref:MarC family protein n=1 Tax=Algoriphagus aurantiacus TaxID=3103948 RepID=UPI002B39E620|nr:MarC family protein [Algoriphagus sp. D3-2-R+10]MEB2774470.1 MarC family protein [Algoriphagus sp. D3-2-R+10]
MDNILAFTLSVFTGFFAIMNPIANVPIFASLTDDLDKATKRSISKRATLTAFVIVVVFVVLGKFIFEIFGITIPAFKITGGILIFYVGFEMLQSKKSSVKHIKDPEIEENIAISPLAIPILAGPGTIVTAMNFASQGDYLNILIVIAVFAGMCFLTHIAFELGDQIVKRLGKNLIVVIGKIMGLIIAIIGTNMIISGIKAAFLE